MNYLQFRTKLLPLGVFSIKGARMYFPNLDSRRLVEWQQKGYIIKLINRWYMFSEITLEEHQLFRISNVLNQPAYVSLESALSYYNFIPEGAYTTQTVTTSKTMHYDTAAGSFNYRHLKPDLYFGYHIMRVNGVPALIAEPEKALLDYLYLNSRIRQVEDIRSLRLNHGALQMINWDRFDQYAGLFSNGALTNRINLLKRINP